MNLSLRRTLIVTCLTMLALAAIGTAVSSQSRAQEAISVCAATADGGYYCQTTTNLAGVLPRLVVIHDGGGELVQLLHDEPYQGIITVIWRVPPGGGGR